MTGSGCIPGTYTTPASLTWSANTNCTVYFTTPQTMGVRPTHSIQRRSTGGPSTITNPLTVIGSRSTNHQCQFHRILAHIRSRPGGQAFGSQGGLSSFTSILPPSMQLDSRSECQLDHDFASGSKGTAKVNYAIAATVAGREQARFLLAARILISIKPPLAARL